MDIGYNFETYFTIFSTSLGLVISILIIRLDWKRYGTLFLLSALVGNSLCYMFVKLGFYNFPYRLFPKLSIMPIEFVTFVFPAIVLCGVRYSPKRWAYKIAFYWGIVHAGMFFETLGQNFSRIIKYTNEWDLWDSYTWWWIYLLVFEWIGGKILIDNLRKPIHEENFKYGRPLWFVSHFILITTIFLGGYYLGFIRFDK